MRHGNNNSPCSALSEPAGAELTRVVVPGGAVGVCLGTMWWRCLAFGANRPEGLPPRNGYRGYAAGELSPAYRPKPDFSSLMLVALKASAAAK